MPIKTKRILLFALMHHHPFLEHRRLLPCDPKTLNPTKHWHLLPLKPLNPTTLALAPLKP
jgi:hypothetical protein